MSEEKWVVYRGSIYNLGPIDHDALWRISEAEWDDRPFTANATLITRGLTAEMAQAMINLTKEQCDGEI